ncbi:MAG: bifunctional adenosylcobinamide kinase/adenosylcobinamide-phosphate guanylyltransferase [Tissierellia bacterium]|nr:bifunctional adenosylcobinamide kinase/adenosylcobinamide-phosphate guanylyltransferase [Tissierellia bacterium]
MIRLITGGARSGKSSFAENKIKECTSVTYIATSQVWDKEMEERVRLHRERRPIQWKTWESPLKLSNCPYVTREYLLDCVTLFTTNHLFDVLGEGDSITPELQKQIENNILRELRSLIDFVQKNNGNLQIVTNEVGSSIVPENHISRVFRDIQGRINQELGRLSDEVYLVVCGIGVKIK